MKRFPFAFFELPIPSPLNVAEDASTPDEPPPHAPAAESGVHLPDERRDRRAPTGTES